jgi:hypothetical protein
MAVFCYDTINPDSINNVAYRAHWMIEWYEIG